MLKVENITFAYGENTTLKNLSFTCDKGQHLAIVGESGSGKTTLLKLIYGELDLDQGSISWKNEKVLGPKYNLVVGQDYIKYVAQEFDLMPYITVAENIGKHLSNFYLDKKSHRINTLLNIVELQAFAHTKVQFLSGGQKQRVALAQALAKAPEILLLDEPFSHIDNFKKQKLRRSVFNYLKENQISCIIATHDKEDVLPFSDTMVVLQNGKVVASGNPLELYSSPGTPQVASFFGEYNLLDDYGLVYAHNLTVVPKSDIFVTVKRSYFKGSYYLIESVQNDKTIFFENPTPINENQEVFLKIKS